MPREARLKFLKKMIILGPKTAILGPQFCRILVLGPHFWWSGGAQGPPSDPPLLSLRVCSTLADLGGADGAPQQDPILSFLHTFLPKSAHVGGWRPPNGKSWIRHCSTWGRCDCEVKRGCSINLKLSEKPSHSEG